VPNEDTYITEEHKIFYNREMIKVKHLVNGETIIRKKMRKEIVYNVLLEGETSGKMIANGMISETLDPRSEMVKLLLLLSEEDMTDWEKGEIIKEINKNMKEEHKRRERSKKN
jgi:predicted transcriptional regulator